MDHNGNPPLGVAVPRLIVVLVIAASPFCADTLLPSNARPRNITQVNLKTSAPDTAARF
jgi:hypothetical protein